MEKMFSVGLTSLLLLWCLQGCWCKDPAPVSVKVPRTVEVIKGDTAILPCSVTVRNPSSSNILEWFIEEGSKRHRVAFRPQLGGEGQSDQGTRLSGRVTIWSNFSLSISPVHVEDEKNFTCQMTAGPDGVAEGTTELRVFVEPEKPEVTVTSQVISVTDSSVSEVGHCVSRNGHPKPRIIWYQDSQPLPEVKDSNQMMYMVPSLAREASGLYTASSTLYLKPKKEDRESIFHCKVEYNMTSGQIMSKDSAPFNLTLHYPAEHVTFGIKSPGPIKEGDTVELRCETDGYPQPEFDFVFIKEGKEVTKQGHAGILTLSPVKRTDAGVYRCEALDFDAAEVDLTKNLTLSIHHMDPVMITPAGPVTVDVGKDVELFCKTKASAEHALQWRKGSEVVSETESLSLKSVSYSDAGEYICVGSVPSVPGLHKHANVTLTVSGSPKIKEPSGATEVQKEGDQVTLTCSARGHPAPQFTWTPSGKESVEVQGNKVISTVTLEATAAVLEKGVTCQVSNTFGTDTMAFKVAIKQDAPTDSADSNSADRADRQQGGSSGVVIAVVVCVLLLLLLVAILYFLQKNRKLPCGKQDKKDVAGGEVNNDIVVEMKSDKANEEAGLLNKRPATEQ
ncbi:basal cell adhesion molecule isoform X2 [Megalops cyprinoides]|uniref:basal cell adhesion molecule isoform X2 n=1 Tax=Megalops cyprinoides TaxID=118141 RepID=UPI0018648F9A|nr:basal cell adhesion molecule isoform X2 [Megalops cyprinoides]